MKLIKLLMLFCIGAFFLASNAIGQNANPGIAVAPSNAGVVSVGGTNDLTITVNNSLAGNIATAKLRPIVTIPSSVAFLANASQTGLPAGWTILTNTGSQLRLCNTSDVIGGNESRTIILKVQGVTITGFQTFTGQINFGNGTTCAAGTSVAGNVTADDFATSTIEVIAAAACAITGATATAPAIACFGGTTTLTVAAVTSGATGALEYNINGGAFQSSPTFTVPAGTYTAIAREVATPACLGTSTALVVSQPTAVIASGSVSSPIAVIGGSGSITVTNSGGTAGTTTYAIVSGTTTNTTGLNTGVFTGLLAGTYTFTATKATCLSVVSAGVVLNDPAPCIITGVSASAGTISCNAGTTTLTATAVPAGTYQYSLNGGTFQASNTFTVAGGSYTIVARETANPVCTATSTTVVVANPAAVVVTPSVSTPIAIPGGTGTITVAATGGTGTFSYVTTTGTTINTTGVATGVFTSLSAGSYSFTATTSNGCIGVGAIVLASPGIATADPSVGQMYFTTTAGGVQDANNLLLTPSTAVYDINVPFFNLNQVNAIPNGTINLTVNLGAKLILNPGFSLATAPLSGFFTWAQSNVGGNVILTGTQIATIPADFDAIATFRVKGDSACRSNVVSNIVITNVLQTLADDDLNNNLSTLQYTLPITITNTQVNVTCNGAANGIINVTVTSGTTVVTTGPGGYTNTQNIASGVNAFTISGLVPGTYTITATAPSNPGTLASCSIVNTVIISQPVLLVVANNPATTINNSCFNGADGSITATATGGTAPYTFTIAGPTVNTTGAINGVFTGLTAGSYTVTVTDNNGCTSVTTLAIVITQPVGGIPDISLGSDITSSFFATPGVAQTIVYNIAEIAGNSAVGDTLRITKINGFTITFNPTLFSTVVGSSTYALDNTRWKIDNSNPAFVSIILTDPLNAANPGTLLCNTLVRISITLTRNTSNISTFPLSARLRRANGEVNLTNNFNSIVFAAQ